nr:MAG TPA: hypothetical protein [Caudoviricetes sp.]
MRSQYFFIEDGEISNSRQIALNESPLSSFVSITSLDGYLDFFTSVHLFDVLKKERSCERFKL